MKSNLKKMLSLTLAILMLLLVAVPLISCTGGNDEPDDEPCTTHPDDDGNNICDDCGETISNDPGSNPGDPSTGGGKKTYTVTLKSGGGMPLGGVMVYVHKGTGYNSVGRAETDENGEASFELDVASDYTIEIDGGGLEGYNINDRYSFDPTGTATITLISSPIKDDDIDSVDYYELGDVVHDFTITDTDGNEWTVSEVLAEKQLLMLNFWYTTCTYCVQEFPHIASAYDRYSDKVEVFAINDYYGDTFNAIKGFKLYDDTGAEIPLNFPKFQITGGPTIDKFDSTQTGYPVTVMIDRYGVICLVQIGGVPSERMFTNAFDHFTAEYYEQNLYLNIDELTPVEKPNITMEESSVFEEILNKDGLQATYRPEADDEYSWPFVPVDTNNDGVFDAVKTSNYDKDNSYAMLYADVYLERGQALSFEYLCSTQYQSDVLYVIVDGKDIYSISGVSENNEWEKCYPWVAQYDGTFEVALVYLKDIAEYEGSDTVCFRNFKAVDPSEIDVPSYIYRYAATSPNDAGDAYEQYVDIVLGSDGYYHVGEAEGPILFAHLLGYTLFDDQKTVFERLYQVTDAEGNYTFKVDGVEMFTLFEAYGMYASNSDLYGYCPVTEELRGLLEAYVQQYRQTTGMAQHENLWLTLCCYYDAYGTGGKQMEDPIKGLSSFSAYDVELDTETVVTYEKLLVPRGLLYEFIPTESGVYRVTSNSDSSVIGWIFSGDHNSWYSNGVGRIEVVNSDIAERFSNELYIVSYSIPCSGCGTNILIEEDATSATCPDPNCQTVNTDMSGKTESGFINVNNVSYAAYLEAGVPYYIAIAYQDTEKLGSFTFNVKYVGESFDYFVSASPGPFSFELNEDGSSGSTIGGVFDISYALCTEDTCEDCAAAAASVGAAAGTKYYHHILPDGTLGSIIYADFSLTTAIFPSQSVLMLIDIPGAFNFTNKEYSGADYTEIMEAYAATILDEDGYPERQGCVPVDEQLAEILQLAVDNYLFPYVEGGWLKFCYYYKHLGA